MPREYPDARIVIQLATEGHELEKELDRLNPILKEILIGRIRPTPGDPIAEGNFGRLTFSQTK